MRSLRPFRKAVARPVLITLALMALLWMIPPALSAPAQAEPAVEDSRDGIPAAEERRLQHLFWAYNVIWLLLGIYVISLGARLRAVNRELARMESRLQQGNPSSGSH